MWNIMYIQNSSWSARKGSTSNGNQPLKESVEAIEITPETESESEKVEESEEGVESSDKTDSIGDPVDWNQKPSSIGDETNWEEDVELLD